MAKSVMLRHPQTGIVRKGFYGFSWTTLFFGGVPAFFRGELMIGLGISFACLFSAGLFAVVWAFFYNKSYTLRLIEKGYQFADSEAGNALARAKLGVTEVHMPVAISTR